LELLPAGTFLGGKFIITQVLGIGGSSVVYKGHSPEFEDNFFALKIFNRRKGADSVLEDRFRSEIGALYDVEHPNIVRPYTFFRDGPLLVLVLEYVQGGDLRGLLDKQRKFTLPEIISILSRVADALQSIHDVGMIHRDLKPENILIPAINVPKITDFGVALLTGGPRFTARGSIVGTAYYVSPEYIEFDMLDSRSDIYSLGIIAYELVAGRIPFEGETITQILNTKILYELPSIHELADDVPDVLADVLERAVNRDPRLRFQKASEMRDALLDVLRRI